jgi:hypothetical protein
MFTVLQCPTVMLRTVFASTSLLPSPQQHNLLALGCFITNQVRHLKIDGWHKVKEKPDAELEDEVALVLRGGSGVVLLPMSFRPQKT